MKTFIKNVSKCFCLALFFSSSLCFAHDWQVHMAITGNAYKLSAGLQTFLNENVETNKLTASPPQYSDTTTASNWLAMGSKMEDEQYYGSFPIKQFKETFGLTERSVDHFYTVMPERTPGQVIGLTDWSEPPVIGLTIIGPLAQPVHSSFQWATDPNVQGPFRIGTNVYKWGDARNYEFAALTNTTADARNTSMAMML
jgi:hypothetical protein